MKIAAILQARTTSTRLPRKVLMELPYGGGVTVLEQVIRRLKSSSRLDEIIIATTINNDDDDIVAIAEKEGLGFFRGSEEDVLSRYYHSAKEHGFDVVVRVTSDCPCIDPSIVDAVIESHIESGADYTSNTQKRTYPRGLDVEVFSFKVLEQAFNEAKKPHEREHVTPYLYDSANGFKLNSVEADLAESRPNIRVTLDTKEDYLLLCAVYDALYEKSSSFGFNELRELFDAKQWLGLINEAVSQKKLFSNLQEELTDAVGVLNAEGLERASGFISEVLARGQGMDKGGEQ
jgi:spore coat polysaccharide biosynthesis protein SpsF